MLNNYLYDFLSHAQLQIYIIRAKLRNIRSSFFLWYAQKQFLRAVVWAFPFGSGFPLQSLTWVKGISLSCTCTLAHGLSRPGVRFRPLRQAAWPKPDIGRKDKRNTSVRAVTRGFGCSPKPPVPRPARKSSPAFVRQPESDRAPIYFSRPYLLALGNGRSRLSGRLLFPAPGK